MNVPIDAPIDVSINVRIDGLCSGLDNSRGEENRLTGEEHALFIVGSISRIEDISMEDAIDNEIGLNNAGSSPGSDKSKIQVGDTSKLSNILSFFLYGSALLNTAFAVKESSNTSSEDGSLSGFRTGIVE